MTRRDSRVATAGKVVWAQPANTSDPIDWLCSLAEATPSRM